VRRKTNLIMVWSGYLHVGFDINDVEYLVSKVLRMTALYK
jgi:hypothetical protein